MFKSEDVALLVLAGAIIVATVLTNYHLTGGLNKTAKSNQEFYLKEYKALMVKPRTIASLYHTPRYVEVVTEGQVNLHHVGKVYHSTTDTSTYRCVHQEEYVLIDDLGHRFKITSKDFYHIVDKAKLKIMKKPIEVVEPTEEVAMEYEGRKADVVELTNSLTIRDYLNVKTLYKGTVNLEGEWR
jgi:hypothetical protein